MPHQKLEQARKKVKKTRAKRKSKKLKRRMKKRKRKQRIKANNPEGARERVQATGHQAKLLAAELGITTERAQDLASAASERIEAAKEAGNLDALDTDGDGDTDLIQALDGAGSAEEEILGGGDLDAAVGAGTESIIDFSGGDEPGAGDPMTGGMDEEEAVAEADIDVTEPPGRNL